MEEDFILNGQGHGNIAAKMLASNFNVDLLRPWVDRKGRGIVTVNGEGGKRVNRFITNSPALLRRDEWMYFDGEVIRIMKDTLQAVDDLRSNGLVLNVPNAFGKTVVFSQNMGDISPATMSMDGARRGDSDRPEFDGTNIPLPIIHKDFKFTAREIAVSRNSGTPLDTTVIELAGRQVAEEAEKLLLGTSIYNGFQYGGGTIYGYTTYPDRLTKSLTAPDGTNGATIVNEWLEMKNQLYASKYRGPYLVYVSPDYDAYLDSDYSEVKGDGTLRNRIKKIEKFENIKVLDYLPGKTVIIVQKQKSTIREIIGMDLTTLQWQENGGMDLNFKIMAIMVPQLRGDIKGNCGILHASVPEEAPTTTTTTGA